VVKYKENMKNQKTHKKALFHPLVITINLMIILLFGNALGMGFRGLAAETKADTPTESQPDLAAAPAGVADLVTANNCLVELPKFAEPEFEQYKIFMEANFKNKSNTSSLMNLGMQRYGKFKEDVWNKLEVLIGEQLSYAGREGAMNAIQIQGLSDCQNMARNYIDEAAKMLKIRAISTSGIKKASIFVEKYKQINSKLRSLDLEIMKMVVNLSTFEQKLPCYLKTCN